MKERSETVFWVLFLLGAATLGGFAIGVMAERSRRQSPPHCIRAECLERSP